MEGAGSDKKNMVGAHHAITSIHGGAFNDRQNVTLHAFTGNIWSVAAFASGNLVDFVEEDNPGLLHALHGSARYLVHIYQPRLFLLHQILKRFANFHFAFLCTLA